MNLNEVRNEKKKRISLLLEKAVENKPQVSYRSYEPSRTEVKKFPIPPPKEEDFSNLDPW